MALMLLVTGCGGSTTTYRVLSTGMEPTLKVGQHVAVDSKALRGRLPAVGDIVVFHPPAGADSATGPCADPKEGAGRPKPCGVSTPQVSRLSFIKRIVGVPGDRIAIVGGHVLRNGQPAAEPCVTLCASDPGCQFPDPIVIPPDSYYVLGDNRGDSNDSRFWGPIERSWIVGLVP